jgi:hypothetical protein
VLRLLVAEQLRVVTSETLGHASGVAAQHDQVAIEPHHAVELLVLRPVQRHIVVEPRGLEKLPALEDRDARRGQHQGRPDGGPLLGIPARGVPSAISEGTRVWLLATSSGLGVDHPVEGIVVVALADGRITSAIDRSASSAVITASRTVDEGRVPLGMEGCPVGIDPVIRSSRCIVRQ